MEIDEGQLIAQARAGDDAAFRVLMQRHLGSAYAFAFSMTQDAQDAQDAAQEAFLKAWRHLPKFREGAPFKPWLFAILRNATLDALRRKRPIVFSEFASADGEEPFEGTLPDASPLPDELAAREEEREGLERLLEGLSAPSREILLLHDREGLTFDEIGRLLKKPLNTVKSRYRRAILALREALDAPNSRPHP